MIIQLVALLGSLFFMLVFFLIRQYSHAKAARKVRRQEIYRYISTEEKALLKQYIYSMKSDYEVRLISGALYERHSEMDNTKTYYTLGELKVVFPYENQLQYIADNNVIEVALIDQENVVVSINNINLESAYQHYLEEQKQKDAWAKGANQQYTKIQLALDADNLELKVDSEPAQQTASYSVTAQREMTKSELKFTKLQDFTTNFRNKRFLVANCFTLAAIMMTIMLMIVERDISNITPYGIVMVLFGVLFYYLHRRWLIVMKEPINCVQGYITNINKTKKELEISHAIWCAYPPFWDEFIPAEGTFVNAEIKVNSKELVALNTLSLQREAETCGVKQYLINILCYMAVSLVFLIMNMSVFKSSHGDIMINIMGSGLIITINLLFFCYFMYKLYINNKRRKMLTKIYKQTNVVVE